MSEVISMDDLISAAWLVAIKPGDKPSFLMFLKGFSCIFVEMKEIIRYSRDKWVYGMRGRSG
ncbi:hypothetical protein [Lentibacillus juripiscarius]|uniref:hypothetical protein n=1 Tax=Lentibacillus juripiscarius TaxID=257446 RepID=UPI0036D39128